MSIFDASQLMFNNPSFYDGVATQSLNINGNGYLSIQHDTAPTLATKGTVAFWIKLHNNDDRNYVINTTGGSSNNTTMDIRFGGSNTNDGMHIGQYGRTPYTASTTGPKQRDLSAWYHCLVSFDSTSSTASERQMKIFINGVQVTAGTFGAISQNDLFPFTQQTHAIRIGRHISVGYYLDAYLADFYIIDGQALTPDNFTEIKEGICIPKAYEGTYGNNGIRLEFKGTGTATSSGVVSSPTNIGDDSSGNNNHFAVTTLSAHDSNMPDSPENNFPTFFPIFKTHTGVISWINNSVTFSEGNLRVNLNTSNETQSGAFATFTVPTSGKWYWEILCIAEASTSISGTGVIEASTGTYIRSASNTSGRTYGAGDIINVAFDADNNRIFFGINGTFPADQTPTDSSDGTAATGSDYLPYVWGNHGGSANQFAANFGQDSSFAGQKSSGSDEASDASGIGDFYDTPPSGFLALCSANLPNTTLSPNQSEQANDHFNTVLYTGDGNATQNVTGVGFMPDFTWLKEKSSSSGNVLADSSRGYEKFLTSHTYNAESTGILNNNATRTNDGFQTTNSGASNENGQTYVAWNWKANGGTKTTVSIGDISSGVPSIASEVQANTKAGFSIVLYTGTGASSGTIAHGLGAVPKLIIVKNRDEAYNWKVYHGENTSAPETDYLVLDTTDATADNVTHWNDTAPDANVFTIGSSNGLIKNTNKYLAYCFAEIEGYSKFGSYAGNGAANGTFIFTGFRPAFMIIKRRDAANYWLILDNKRETFNQMNRGLYANLADQENSFGNGTGIDFVSNGFKHRDNVASTNASGGSYIYIAFAEAPFKFANAR